MHWNGWLWCLLNLLHSKWLPWYCQHFQIGNHFQPINHILTCWLKLWHISHVSSDWLVNSCWILVFKRICYMQNSMRFVICKVVCGIVDLYFLLIIYSLNSKNISVFSVFSLFYKPEHTLSQKFSQLACITLWKSCLSSYSRTLPSRTLTGPGLTKRPDL